MNLENLVGQTLDGKYKIEKELGKGGMGAVYFATHLGTERPVALKVIVPQFMQRAEFVERFRREARAAGRLRHPNVVDVTDFGFAETSNGRVAYLVMEYLDGCTLGEILDEEKKLPLAWTIDILEQVSSAVDEAHGQGIIHRDLKPDNIWLEPNQRGGYTVKVLDFGIAKLETGATATHDLSPLGSNVSKSSVTQAISQNVTAADADSQTISEPRSVTAARASQTVADFHDSKTLAAEAGTLIQPLAEISPENETAIFSKSENETAILSKVETNEPDTIGTKILTPEHKSTAPVEPSETKSLTRVGAVLGTPLYMSPEQCRGEHLDARSDIYSLGVIAYQMLSGKTPFTGSFTDVMDAHKKLPPPPLDAKKIPRKVKKAIADAMSKDATQRPQTAAAFASELRSYSEGIGALLRRSLTIYSEHLPKFLGLAILFYLPFIFVTALKVTNSFLYAETVISGQIYSLFNGLLLLLTTFTGMFSGYLVFGTTTWIVSQILAMPLRPVKLRPALDAVRKRWKSLLGTGMISSVLTLIGYTLCLVPGVILSVNWALVAPIVMMENLRGRAALKRSRILVKRSMRTTIAAIFIMFFVPFILASLTSFFVATTVKSFSNTKEEIAAVQQQIKQAQEAKGNASGADKEPVVVKTGNGVNISFGDDDGKPKILGINGVVHEISTTILTLPLQILIASFSSIIVALLYLKTRQAGGEPMQDLLLQFEEADRPRSNWQKRVRERLIQSGRAATGRSTSLERQSGGGKIASES